MKDLYCNTNRVMKDLQYIFSNVIHIISTNKLNIPFSVGTPHLCGWILLIGT